MAGDLFCWPCACVFVLCEHMAFVLVFCVPCALMSIVLTPPILLPDYWLICPTCVTVRVGDEGMRRGLNGAGDGLFNQQ